MENMKQGIYADHSGTEEWKGSRSRSKCGYPEKPIKLQFFGTCGADKNTQKRSILRIAAAFALAVILAAVEVNFSGGLEPSVSNAVTANLPTASAPPSLAFSIAASAEKYTYRYKSEGSVAVGSSVLFGTYPQTAAGTDNTPIGWQVIAEEGDKVLLLSQYKLDVGWQCDLDFSKSASWEQSYVREWLNDEFLSAAFSPDEVKMIVPTRVSADKNPKYDTDPGWDVTDRIFLLSIDEVEKYLDSYSERSCYATDYAMSKVIIDGKPASYGWWLRTPGETARSFAVVKNGEIDYSGSPGFCDYFSIRPAMWVALQ